MTKVRYCRLMILSALVLLLIAGGSYAMKSGDSYIEFKDSAWTFGTSMVERKVAFHDGNLSTIAILNKALKKDITGNASDEFSFAMDSAANRITGTSGGWKLVDWKSSKHKNGELELDIILERDGIEVTKTYIVFPKTSIIREWASIKNNGSNEARIIEPSYLDLCAKIDDAEHLDFHWMTGAENWPGSWTLRTEKLAPGSPRKFDTYDPSQLPDIKLPGDGVKARILKNDMQIWPEEGWAYSPNASVTEPFDFSIHVEKGDRLTFTTNINKEISNDTTAFNPTITYSDGESHNAADEFSGEQGRNNWRYCYIEDGKYVDLFYYEQHKQWRKKIDNATGTPFIGAGTQHPHPDQDAALVWIAPKSGDVRIQGGVTNIGNAGGPDRRYGYKLNTQVYAPWYALKGTGFANGMFIGYDFFGHNVSTFDIDKDGNVRFQLRVAGHDQLLKPGEVIELPKAFTGLFDGDLDNAGNECLNWQYMYMWDYTRKGWFPAVRMLGYWMKGTSWTTGWLGGQGDWHSAYQKIFRTIDLMRTIGGDVYHRDWGWWDRAGDWNGPDFKSANQYLRKYGMGLLIYAFLYTVDPESKVAKEHPDWLADPVTLDMSIPEVVDFMKGQLDEFREKWGPFEWRNDSTPFVPRNGDDTVLLGQDMGFRRLLKEFLDSHPDCAFQAVNGGGHCAGYDYVRYASTIQFSDGGAGLLSNYYATLLFPPDKTNHMPDIWNPDAYDPATFHGLLCGNFDMTGDTWDPDKLEGLREMIDIYHYLQTQGVVGRWVKVYRPIIDGDDPTMYFQRMNRDNTKGIIITKHLVEKGVTIRPKGLLPNTEYSISYQYGSGNDETRLGSSLMEIGIYIAKMMPGELIYLNIPNHPGSRMDKSAPSTPEASTKRESTNMGYPGVELKWSKSRDNNWVSYYAIYRDGELIDKASKGLYYFDHSAGADVTALYEVQAYDGAGNASERVTATGKEGTPAIVIDDRSPEIIYWGQWNRLIQEPAHRRTLSASNVAGDMVEMDFDGSEIRWYSKLGDNCGIALVNIDGGKDEVVDTYAADDVWGVCVFRKKVKPGAHRICIVISGENNLNSKDTYVHIDGFQIR